MDYAPRRRYAQEGVAADFAAFDGYVVAPGDFGRNAEVAERAGHHAAVTGESRRHVGRRGHHAEHEVVGVGIDASAAAFAAIELNPFFAAVGEVYLCFDDLVSAENDRRAHGPGEEILAGIVAGQVFLHGQEPRQVPPFGGSRGKYGMNQTHNQTRRAFFSPGVPKLRIIQLTARIIFYSPGFPPCGARRAGVLSRPAGLPRRPQPLFWLGFPPFSRVTPPCAWRLP